MNYGVPDFGYTEDDPFVAFQFMNTGMDELAEALWHGGLKDCTASSLLHPMVGNGPVPGTEPDRLPDVGIASAPPPESGEEVSRAMRERGGRPEACGDGGKRKACSFGSDREDGGEDIKDKKKDVKKYARRTRSAEIHNLSERRRRQQINEKMKTLQELIPRCNKSDKASMLEDAVEYLKSLKQQIQMMSMSCMMSPMMFPGYPHHAPNLVGMNMGARMDSNTAQLFRPLLPFASVVTSNSISGSSSVQSGATMTAQVSLPVTVKPDLCGLPARHESSTNSAFSGSPSSLLWPPTDAAILQGSNCGTIDEQRARLI